jgi:hypothetical protein
MIIRVIINLTDENAIEFEKEYSDLEDFQLRFSQIIDNEKFLFLITRYGTRTIINTRNITSITYKQIGD